MVACETGRYDRGIRRHRRAHRLWQHEDTDRYPYRGADSELFFLHQRSKPDELRIELSRALGAYKRIRGDGEEQAQDDESPGRVSIADELTKLAALAERGILTPEEFSQLKAKLIAEL